LWRGFEVSAQLVRLAQQGDRAAFESLAEAALDRLYATAALVLHDRTLAEDAVQETLIRAWRSLPRLRDPDRFDAWLRRVLVHACIDTARSERHQRTEQELPAELTDGDDVATVAVERDAVERAFATLSPAHRAAFVLRHYHGHSVAEVADALHVRLGTAKSRIHYAEQAMARAMDADEHLAPLGGVA
jgi:RNA polymerase sigma-70 factor, ECF subfamily